MPIFDGLLRTSITGGVPDQVVEYRSGIMGPANIELLHRPRAINPRVFPIIPPLGASCPNLMLGGFLDWKPSPSVALVLLSARLEAWGAREGINGSRPKDSSEWPVITGEGGWLNKGG